MISFMDLKALGPHSLTLYGRKQGHHSAEHLLLCWKDGRKSSVFEQQEVEKISKWV